MLLLFLWKTHFPALPTEGPENSDWTCWRRAPSLPSAHPLSKNAFPVKATTVHRLIPGLGKEMDPISLGYVVVSEGWAIIQGDLGCVKRTQESSWRSPTGPRWDNSSSKSNKDGHPRRMLGDQFATQKIGKQKRRALILPLKTALQANQILCEKTFYSMKEY